MFGAVADCRTLLAARGGVDPMGDRRGEAEPHLGHFDDAGASGAADSDFGLVCKTHCLKQLRFIVGEGVELDDRSVTGAKDRQGHSGGGGGRSGQGGVSTISPCLGLEHGPDGTTWETGERPFRPSKENDIATDSQWQVGRGPGVVVDAWTSVGESWGNGMLEGCDLRPVRAVRAIRVPITASLARNRPPASSAPPVRVKYE